VDWRRDLHFQTRTTIDTLDYSGSGFNKGSKVVIAATGGPIRDLPSELPGEMSLPDGFRHPRVIFPGVIAVESPRFEPDFESDGVTKDLRRFVETTSIDSALNRFPLVTLVDDSDFTARSLRNWLWVAFTRSNPASDIEGVDASVASKHWGCHGALVIDARIKPHHAPPLVEDPETTAKVDARAARGGPLSKYL
jgi:4-hydroxy-3-polyprenylbenzoate decarboxylase